MSTKYTEEVLTEAVANSLSYAGVLRFLGLRQAGGTQSHIISRVKLYGIDTSHFKQQAHNKGKVSSKRLTADEILIMKPEGSARTKRYLLVRAMLEVGFKYVCAPCGQIPNWNNKPLLLEVDHIDGSWLNNLRENLRFICPNCHSQELTSNKPYKYRNY